MTGLLFRLFIGNGNDVQIRRQYGILAGATALLCNLLLCAVKFVLGAVSGSIAVTADAFNNLSDAGSAAAALFGFYIAAKPADREHPYGHGRSEYVGGLAVAFFVLLVGVELLRSSVVKIFQPQPVVFSWVTVIGLGVTVPVKLWLSRFQAHVGRKINSTALSATAADSISDVMATGVTIAAVVAARFTRLPLDGYMGAVVALVILNTGVKVAKDTLAPLLGKAPDPELLDKIKGIALECEGVLDVHDLIVHDYGPGRIYASMHVEVDMWRGARESHRIIDGIEKKIARDLGIDMVLHMDPKDTECSVTARLYGRVEELVREYDAAFLLHDFSVEEAPGGIEMSFDICIPIEYKKPDAEICAELIREIKAIDPAVNAQITVDRVI